MSSPPEEGSFTSYSYPPDAIATCPCTPREKATLMVVKKEKRLFQTIGDLPNFLTPSDVLVLNDTKVYPARLLMNTGYDKKVEVLLNKPLCQSHRQWEALINPMKGTKETLFFKGHQVTAEKQKGRFSLIKFHHPNPLTLINQYGSTPIPPYILKKRPLLSQDKTDYQTVYAKTQGAVAAPTAGLHFTPNLLKTIQNKNIPLAFITLHVSAGTFLPLEKNQRFLHAEYMEINQKTATLLNQAQKNQQRIISVGTTVLRALETCLTHREHFHPFQGETKIFITPGFVFKAVDVLFTNFHLPHSSLLPLICAFAGEHLIKTSYQEALKRNCKIGSYGDACLFYRT